MRLNSTEKKVIDNIESQNNGVNQTPFLDYVSSINVGALKAHIEAMPNVFTRMIMEFIDGYDERRVSFIDYAFGKASWFFRTNLPLLYSRAKTHTTLHAQLLRLEQVTMSKSVNEYPFKQILEEGVVHLMSDIMVSKCIEKMDNYVYGKYPSSAMFKDKDLFAVLSNDLVPLKIKKGILSTNPTRLFTKSVDLHSIGVDILIEAIENMSNTQFQSLILKGNGNHITADLIEQIDLEVSSYIMENAGMDDEDECSTYRTKANQKKVPIGLRWKTIKAVAEYWEATK